MKKSDLLRALLTEIRRHTFDTFVPRGGAPMGRTPLLCMLMLVAVGVFAQNSEQPKPSARSLAVQGKRRLPQRGNAIIMDDGLEYAVIDYGLGKIQVRSSDNEDSFSPQVFWVKFRIANRTEHSILKSSYSIWDVTDNWGNSYYMDDKFIGGRPPIPESENIRPTGPSSWDDHYRPGDSS